jgi:hypothetical protein
MNDRIKEAIRKSEHMRGDVVIVQTRDDAEFDHLELDLRDASDENYEEIDRPHEWGMVAYLADEDGVVQWCVKLLRNLALR